MKMQLESWALPPIREHATDAGMDLKTPIEFTIIGHGYATIDTGVHIQLPHGTYGKIESKSGLNVYYGIVSCGGVIDEGYTGRIKVKLYSFDDYPHHFDRGDKIAQMIVQPCLYVGTEIVEDLEETERGSNGFGSTGR